MLPRTIRDAAQWLADGRSASVIMVACLSLAVLTVAQTGVTAATNETRSAADIRTSLDEGQDNFTTAMNEEGLGRFGDQFIPLWESYKAIATVAYNHPRWAVTVWGYGQVLIWSAIGLLFVGHVLRLRERVRYG